MIDIRMSCDECNGQVSDSDDVFCASCYDKLAKENETLKEEIEKLKKEMVDIGMGGENKWAKHSKTIVYLLITGFTRTGQRNGWKREYLPGH